MKQLVECVPNFSEGRDRALIDKIVAAMAAVKGVKVLDVDPGADTNRTVVTLIGEPAPVAEAAFQGIRRAAELIDMSNHSGAHPRIGATDVCPFVPVSGVTMADCAELARQVGRRVGDELGIPVYLYEAAAASPQRVNLADVRAGEYEGLADKLRDPAWKPDFGPATFNARAGATVIGAREFLIAYNINFNTRDAALVNDIALEIREKGRVKKDAKGAVVKDAQGEKVWAPGKFKAVKAIGWYIEQYGCAQLSINFNNYKISPVHEVFVEVCRQAEMRGLRVTGSELVGLIPKQALLDAGAFFLTRQGKPAGAHPHRGEIAGPGRADALRSVEKDHRSQRRGGESAAPPAHGPARVRQRAVLRLAGARRRIRGFAGGRAGGGSGGDGVEPDRGQEGVRRTAGPHVARGRRGPAAQGRIPVRHRPRHRGVQRGHGGHQAAQKDRCRESGPGRRHGGGEQGSHAGAARRAAARRARAGAGPGNGPPR